MMRSPHDLDVVQRLDRDVHSGVTGVDVEPAAVRVGAVLDDSTFPAVAAPATVRTEVVAELEPIARFSFSVNDMFKLFSRPAVRP